MKRFFYLFGFLFYFIPTPVLQFTLEGILVEEFASAKEAHIKYGFSQCRIGLCCNGKIKKYKNYVWKFKQ